MAEEESNEESTSNESEDAAKDFSLRKPLDLDERKSPSSEEQDSEVEQVFERTLNIPDDDPDLEQSDQDGMELVSVVPSRASLYSQRSSVSYFVDLEQQQDSSCQSTPLAQPKLPQRLNKQQQADPMSSRMTQSM